MPEPYVEPYRSVDDRLGKMSSALLAVSRSHFQMPSMGWAVRVRDLLDGIRAEVDKIQAQYRSEEMGPLGSAYRAAGAASTPIYDQLVAECTYVKVEPAGAGRMRLAEDPYAPRSHRDIDLPPPGYPVFNPVFSPVPPPAVRRGAYEVPPPQVDPPRRPNAGIREDGKRSDPRRDWGIS